MKVLGDKVLVKVSVAEEKKTEGGIIIPDSVNQERKYEGVVVAVGNHPDVEKYCVKVGDYVIYPRGLNTEIKIENVLHDIVSIYDLLAIKED